MPTIPLLDVLAGYDSTQKESFRNNLYIGNRNEANGYVGIDGSGDVLGTFAQRRDTAANIASIVLKSGELAFTTDTKETFIGDGVTAGGLFCHQTPQLYQKGTKFSVNDRPANGSANPNQSMLLPQVKTGQVIRVRAYASFASESTNNSNFVVNINPQGSMETNATLATSIRAFATWYTGGLQIAKSINEVTSPTTGLVISPPSTHLTLSDAVVEIDAYIAGRASPIGDSYSLAIQLLSRLGGLVSTVNWGYAEYWRIK